MQRSSSTSDWQELSRERVYDGYRKVDRVLFRLPDGNEAYFDVVVSGEAVCALVITVEGDIVLFNQYRPGPGKVLSELPGGAVDEGESPQQAIAREVLEETGYSGEIVPVGSTYKDAYSSYIQHNFLVRNARKTGEPKHGEHEFGDVSVISMSEFSRVIKSGDLTDLTTAAQVFEFLREQNE